MNSHASTYSLLQIGNDKYRFITEAGNIYSIELIQYWQNELIKIYTQQNIQVWEFNFEVEKLMKVELDKKIAHTIFHVIETYISRAGNMLFFVTHRQDGRSKQLFKLYTFWYRQHQKISAYKDVIKMDRTVESYGEIDAYVSCIYRETIIDIKDKASTLFDEILMEIFPNSTVSPFN